MKGICPNCETIRELKRASKAESVIVKGETFEIKSTIVICSSCNAEFDDPKEKTNTIEQAYSSYRAKYGLLQPDEIKAFRNKYGLTQQELGQLLGWGLATLSRYENGALQDDCHEKTLRLAMNPSNLLELIKETPNALVDKKRGDLVKALQSEQEEANSFLRIYEERFGKYKPNILSGYKKLNISKMFAAILFFCSGGTLKTKLNKLLFYADFLHFRKNTVSITGAYYAHLPYGPVPDNYEYYFATLIHENKSLNVVEQEFSANITGELYISKVQPDLNIFEESELETLFEVKKHFKDTNATQIKNISHEENAFKNTKLGEYISYDFAEDLNWKS